jgi:hypothetical protein
MFTLRRLLVLFYLGVDVMELYWPGWIVSSSALEFDNDSTIDRSIWAIEITTYIIRASIRTPSAARTVPG